MLQKAYFFYLQYSSCKERCFFWGGGQRGGGAEGGEGQRGGGAEGGRGRGGRGVGVEVPDAPQAAKRSK